MAATPEHGGGSERTTRWLSGEGEILRSAQSDTRRRATDNQSSRRGELGGGLSRPLKLIEQTLADTLYRLRLWVFGDLQLAFGQQGVQPGAFVQLIKFSALVVVYHGPLSLHF